jgi:DNA primase
VLVRTPAAVDYVVKKRRLNKQIVQDFRIGYSPTNSELFAALSKRGFTERELRDAGLAVTRRAGPSDMFRGRMMVPLMDAQGRVVGFTARILTNDPNAPKYINTPQTLLYDKGRHVFGLHLAKDAIRQAGFAVIVEGNLDVIASHQAGVKQVVATAGTALTEYHLRTLSRFAPDVRLAFDADKAGIAATERAIALASNLGVTLSIVTLPDVGAKDADELIQMDITLWERAIAEPQDAVEWLLDHYATRYKLDTADGKRRATDQVLGVIKSIDDPVLLEHYLQVVASRIGSSVGALNAKLKQQPIAAKPTVQPKKPAAATAPDSAQHQDHLLALAWHYPQLRDSLNRLETQEFTGQWRQAVVEHLKHGTPLLQSDEINVKIGELELIVEAKYPTLSDELYFIASDIAKRTKKEHKQKLLSELSKRFSDTDDTKERKALNTQMTQLIKDIEALKH